MVKLVWGVGLEPTTSRFQAGHATELRQPQICRGNVIALPRYGRITVHYRSARLLRAPTLISHARPVLHRCHGISHIRTHGQQRRAAIIQYRKTVFS